MSQQCCKRVYGGRSVTGYNCCNPAKVQVNGEWYCHVHNPDAVAKRRASLLVKWNAENKRRQAQYRREEAAREAVSFLQIIADGYRYTPGDSDLDDEQPIHVRMTLGDYRRAAQLLHIIKPAAATQGQAEKKAEVRS